MGGNRRQYTAEFKTRAVLQVLTGEKTPAEIAQADPADVMRAVLGAI
jgi:transposase-like protein